MIAMVIRRLALMIPILLGVTFITFVITNATGSPLASLAFNPRISQEDIQRLEKYYGLDKPVDERYFRWLGNLIQGDLGYSMVSGVPVTDRILAVLPNTLLLSSLSIFFAISIALPIGIYCAVHQNSTLDRFFSISAVAGFAIPTVWLSLMLVMFFGVKIGDWGFPTLPVGGVRNLREDGGLADRIEHLILPVVALTIPQLAGWIVYIRSSMLEVIRQEYVRTAQAKGLPSRIVIYSHAFRNALLPLITLVGLSIPDVFAGSLVVENVFAYPGMGQLTVNAVNDKDYTLVMGTTVLFAALIVLGNLIADILYGVMDPRLRHR
jgi:peptide/nickel transport system permease protein